MLRTGRRYSRLPEIALSGSLRRRTSRISGREDILEASARSCARRNRGELLRPGPCARACGGEPTSDSQGSVKQPSAASESDSATTEALTWTTYEVPGAGVAISFPPGWRAGDRGAACPPSSWIHGSLVAVGLATLPPAARTARTTRRTPRGNGARGRPDRHPGAPRPGGRVRPPRIRAVPSISAPTTATRARRSIAPTSGRRSSTAISLPRLGPTLLRPCRARKRRTARDPGGGLDDSRPPRDPGGR